MHVLLIGASGFIGAAVAARLKRDGVRITAVGRSAGTAAGRVAAERWARLDLRHATRPADWLPLLEGVDAVVNAAGVLQDSAKDSTRKVHLDAPAALYAACAQAGVRRIVHISAMGAGEAGLTAFSRTKHAADEALTKSGLDWVILRPSVVLGRAAYGGSALLRGLAALPVLPLLEGAGRIQVVQLDDVAETVALMVRPDAPHGVILDIAGPEPLTFEQVVARYRDWLGWPPARPIRLPPFLMSLAYRAGDLAAWFGWRPPIRTTARREMTRGAVGDPARWSEVTGIVPRSLDQALAAEPASVQERWFARLFLLKPLVFLVFGLFWIATAIVSVGPGYAIGEGLMREAGAGPLSGPSVIAGALADLVIGVGILFRRTAQPALLAALALSIFYVIAVSWLLPRLWAEPLGPMMKIWPILMLNLVALAILEDR
jgi:uncharacterized protein YbjT (DUF2867 family)